MTLTNPFPGMNPYFEQRWRDAHTMLIAYLRDALQEQLPPDLVAGAEEDVVTVGASKPGYRPDVQVREPWTLKEPAPAPAGADPPHRMATEPVRVFLDEELDRWIEIRSTSGRLITVVELLSPSNKVEPGDRERYCRKQRGLISGGVNLVEIDLVRQGVWVFPNGIQEVLRREGACYAVCVFRAERPTEREVYPCGFRERLPVVRVPLRQADSDVCVDLQTLVDQCHQRGRYHLLNYQLPLTPPLAPDHEAWVDQVLRQHGLR